MKKYIKPIVKIVETETSTILAGSDPSTHDEQGNSTWHARGNRTLDLTFDDDEE